MAKLNNSSFDFVVFDFDGVLVESTALKTIIFEEVVSCYSKDQQKTFINYHKLHGGVSRWAKFDYFLREIVKLNNEKEITDTVEKLANHFGIILAEKLKTLELTNGSRELLQKLRSLAKPCFIVSGGAEIEVQSICKRTGIDGFFESILGSPKNKQENMNSLKNSKKLQGQGLFIGDSYTDFSSACEFSMHFIFMSEYSEWMEWKQCEKDFYLIIKNLKELEQILN